METVMHDPSYQDLALYDLTQAAPADAYVVMADIKGSTKAIREGRYRDVNFVGAACIAAVRNQFDPQKVPYVFGGDGATFLVFKDELAQVLNLLWAVKNMASQHLSLRLRVEYVRVGDLPRVEIRYGFLKWGGEEVLPFFRGNGMAVAEKLMKARSEEATIHMETSPEASLSPDKIQGLSCRLMPFNSRRGKVLSVYIEPLVTGRALDLVLQEVFKVLGEMGPISRLSPVHPDNSKRKILSSTWLSEAKMFRRTLSHFSTLFSACSVIIQNFLGWLFLNWNIKSAVIGDPRTYEKYMYLQSDWIKMDGALRLVIDVNAQEEAALRSLLGELEYREKLLFGIHSSESALMTCHFQSKTGQRHVHFIDGSDGGLTLASLGVKEKKRTFSKAA